MTNPFPVARMSGSRGLFTLEAALDGRTPVSAVIEPESTKRPNLLARHFVAEYIFLTPTSSARQARRSFTETQRLPGKQQAMERGSPRRPPRA
jgi:hypothetical protein